LWERLDAGPIEALLDLPLMSDPDRCATMDVLTVLTSPALFTDLNLFRLVVGRMATLSLEHGNTDGSASRMRGWAACWGRTSGTTRPGFASAGSGSTWWKSMGSTVSAPACVPGLCRPRGPLDAALEICRAFLRRAFQAAQDAGDLSYAAYACIDLITNRFATGDPLGEVEREAEDGLEFARKVRFGLAGDCITGSFSSFRTMPGELTPDFNSFNDADFNEDGFSRRLESNPQLAIGACWYWIRKLQACVYAGDSASGIVAAAKGRSRCFGRRRLNSSMPKYHFYAALARGGALR